MGKHKPRIISEEEHENRSKARKKVWASERGAELKAEMSKLKTGNHYSKGHTVTDEHKHTLAGMMHDRISGSVWITDGTVNRRLKHGEPMPDGFKLGRIRR